ncbi:MAG: GDP-L-fucose synthase [Planctomycetes bacterium]|nr:GDP-L-fucose synthase [Planctomycetota bacterium]
MTTLSSNNRICVTGGAGFLGRVVCQVLRDRGAPSIIVPRSSEYDLTRADAARRLFDDHKPDVVIHLAAEVGGIGANQANPGRFFFANMAMGLNLIEEARVRGVDKFVQVGTVCSYPKNCPAPFREESLWDGFPEETNAPYGVAKRTLGVMLDAYRRQYGFNGIYLIPVNLYGPGDNFDPEMSHVIPAMIRKFCDAVDEGRDAVTVWGGGTITREFLYVDDAAEAVVKATETCDDSEPINLGTGREISIADLAQRIASLCGFSGRIEWDGSKPDGQPRRRLDTARATRRLDWRAKVDLEEGLRRTIDWWRSR